MRRLGVFLALFFSAPVWTQERAVLVRDFNIGPTGSVLATGYLGEPIGFGPIDYGEKACYSVGQLQCFDGVEFTAPVVAPDSEMELLSVLGKAILGDKLVFLGVSRPRTDGRRPLPHNAIWTYNGKDLTYHEPASKYNDTDFVTFQDAVYFRGGPGDADISIRNALWRFNGQSVELADDFDPRRGGHPRAITVLGDKLFFRGLTQGGGDLWVFDGESSNRVHHWLTDDAFPQLLTVFNERLYFSAFDAVTGVELWVADEHQAEIVVDHAEGRDNGFPNDIFVFGDRLYVSMLDGLYRLDESGFALEVADRNITTAQTIEFNGLLYFSGGYMQEAGLWTYDGESVSKIQGSSNLSSAAGFHVLDGELYFVGRDEAHGAELWKVTSREPCDFNGNGVCDVSDIDLQSQQIRRGTRNLTFDLDGNEIVDQTDRTIWVHDFAKTYFGDANFDGEFNSSDFTEVFLAGEYEDAIIDNSSWAEGDWNGDGDFTSGDFIKAFLDGGYEQGPRPPLTVSEPSTALLTALALLALATTRKSSTAEDCE